MSSGKVPVVDDEESVLVMLRLVLAAKAMRFTRPPTAFRPSRLLGTKTWTL